MATGALSWRYPLFTRSGDWRDGCVITLTRWYWMIEKTALGLEERFRV
jgi:hypothetical protein